MVNYRNVDSDNVVKKEFLKAVDRVEDLIIGREEFSPGTFFVKVNNRLKDSLFRVEILFWLANTLYPESLKIKVYFRGNDWIADLITAPLGDRDRMVSLYKVKINQAKCIERLGTNSFIYNNENEMDCRLLLLDAFLGWGWGFITKKIKDDFIKKMRDIEIVQS